MTVLLDYASADGDIFNSEIKPEELFKAYFDCRTNEIQ